MKYRVQITANIIQNYTVEAEDEAGAEVEALDLFHGETPLDEENLENFQNSVSNVEVEEIA